VSDGPPPQAAADVAATHAAAIANHPDARLFRTAALWNTRGVERIGYLASHE